MGAYPLVSTSSIPRGHTTQRINNVIITLNHGECAIGISLNFKKAFDTVNHDILLNKLHN